MAITRVGLLSPGDMGHAVGRVLVQHGFEVVTALQGRSTRTVGLAADAGIADVGGIDDVVRFADLVLSILPPAAAATTAERVAAAMSDTGARPVYVDANAVAPATVRSMADAIAGAGAPFVDVGIIGPPPPLARPGVTRFYAAGPAVDAFAELGAAGLDVRSLGDEVGRASALKMTYASLTKGFTLLGVELLTAARLLGVYDDLLAELGQSQAQQLASLEQGVPRVPARADRWSGEMDEVSATFSALGLPEVFAGIAEVCRLAASTELGEATPEDERQRSLAEVIDVLAAACLGGGLPEPR